MRAILAAAAATSVLGGCGLTQQLDANACQGYGLTPGTNAFVNCMMRRDEFRRSALVATGVALMASSSQSNYSPPQPPDPPTRMLCQRNPFGQSGVTCTAQ